MSRVGSGGTSTSSISCDGRNIMKRIGLIFLSCEEISSSELKIFMTQVPLESFHNQPFTTVLSSLGIDLHIPSPPPSSPSIDMPSTSSSKETIQTVPSASTTTSWLIRPQNWHLLGPNGHNENIEMIEISLQYLLHYLENIESIYEYLFVGGISSGGELCLHLLRKFFTFSHKILGIFTIGSYLIESTILSTKNGKPIEENSPSLLMMHGQEDELVPIDWGRFTASNLSIYSSHLDLQFLEFPECGHEIHEEQVLLYHCTPTNSPSPTPLSSPPLLPLYHSFTRS